MINHENKMDRKFDLLYIYVLHMFYEGVEGRGLYIPPQRLRLKCWRSWRPKKNTSDQEQVKIFSKPSKCHRFTYNLSNRLVSEFVNSSRA